MLKGQADTSIPPTLKTKVYNDHRQDLDYREGMGNRAVYYEKTLRLVAKMLGLNEVREVYQDKLKNYEDELRERATLSEEEVRNVYKWRGNRKTRWYGLMQMQRGSRSGSGRSKGRREEIRLKVKEI